LDSNEKQSRADRLKWLRELRAAIPKTADQITGRTLEIWSARLLSIPMPTLLLAANILVDRMTFFPALAEILAVCREVENRVDDRQWKRNLERWEQEALGPGESRKMLTALTGAASKRKGTEIVPFRGRGVKQMLAEVPKRFEVGAGETDEQFEERKRALMEKAGG
jgi:hypothetical protein